MKYIVWCMLYGVIEYSVQSTRESVDNYIPRGGRQKQVSSQRCAEDMGSAGPVQNRERELTASQ